MSKLKVKIAITPKPSNLSSYEILDLITINGRGYLSKKDDNSAPVTDSSSWMKITENTYDSAVRLGYEGTEEDWLSSSATSEEVMQLIVECEQAESERQANEEARIIADQERSPDIYNITVHRPLPEGDYYTLVDEQSMYFVPNGVPSSIRENGLVVTFETSDCKWETYQFFGSVPYSFADRTHWKLLFPLNQAEIEALLENGKLDQFIILLSVTDVAPSYCIVGDRYYNTTSHLIFTSFANDIWPDTGAFPQFGKLYASIEDGVLWYAKLDNSLYPFYSRLDGGKYI